MTCVTYMLHWEFACENGNFMYNLLSDVSNHPKLFIRANCTYNVLEFLVLIELINFIQIFYQFFSRFQIISVIYVLHSTVLLIIILLCWKYPICRWWVFLADFFWDLCHLVVYQKIWGFGEVFNQLWWGYLGRF